MSMTNIMNGRPPVVIEKKDAGGAKKRLRGEGSGEEEGQTNLNARTGISADDDMVAEKAIEAGAPRIIDEPSPWNKYLDVERRRQKRAEQQEFDWAADGLMYDPKEEGLTKIQLDDRLAPIREGWSVGQAQLPVPPAYYNEQRAHRRYAAASEWGIPLGVLTNYSMFASSAEGKAGLTALGNKGSGLGGATSSTKSTAWSIWETSRRNTMAALESWSVDVLGRMWDEEGAERCIEQATRSFDEEEAGFRASIENDELDVREAKVQERQREKDRCMTTAAEELRAQSKQRKMFRLKRVVPFEEMKQLFVENIVTADGLLQSAIERGVPRKFLEQPAAVEKARKSRNEPEPKKPASAV